MSTLRISNIEAKADSSSPTVDEQLKFTNSDGDVLLHLDGRTAGITTVGINTTNQTIKFDSNNNILITGIVTATEFHGSLAVGTSVTYGDNEKAYFGTGLDLELFHNGTNSIINNTEGALLFQNNGSSSMYIASDGQVSLNNDITFVGASANALWDKSENYFSIPDKIVHSGDTNTAIRFPENDTISFETAGTSRIYVEPGGDTGIGTDNPHKRLHVADYGTHGAIRVEGSGNGNRSGIEFYRETSAGVGKGGAAIWVESDTSSSHGKLRFGTASNASVQSQGTDMILDNNGRLGIGTDNPNNPLTVHGSGNHIFLKDTATNNVIQIRHQGGTAQFNTYGTGGARRDFVFSQYSDERLRITSDGNVLIGTQTTAGKLTVDTGGNTTAGYICVTSAGGGRLRLGYAFTSGPSNDQFAEILTDTNGDLDIATRGNNSSQIKLFTSTGSGSEERLRITSGGSVNIGGDYSQTNYPLQVNQGTDENRGLSIKNDEVGLNLGAHGSGHSYGREFSINATRIDNGSLPILRLAGQGGIKFCVDLNTERLHIDSSGRSLFKTNGSQTTPVADDNVPLQIAESTGSMCYFGANKGSTYGSIFGHHTSLGGTVIRNLTSDDIVFMTNNTTERFRISSNGQATFDKGAPSSSNQVIARFQAESSRRLDIVWHDSGSLMGFDTPSNHSYIFKVGGNEKVRITSAGRIGLKNSNPAARVDFAYDSATNGNAFMQFRGPDNKSGEMLHKRVFNGTQGGGDVNLFEVTQWQSTNSRIFGVVKIMAVNPLSNNGYLAEGWFFKADDGSADVGTVTKVHDKGGSVGSLSWSSDTLRYTTPSTHYLDMHISVEYHIYDGGTVVFDTTTRSL